MNAFLEKIIAEKQKEVRKLRYKEIKATHGNPLFPVRDYKGAISRSDRINLIAEIKFASPSAGIIRNGDDPLKIGRIYEQAGAAAISLVTDNRFFRGNLEDLPRLKRAVSLPLLRKDFIIDEIQITESFRSGADALLLIARILSSKQLKRFLSTCQSLGMTALTEVHSQNDLDKAIDCGADIIGINNRDLDTFSVDLTRTRVLAPMVPPGCTIVSESGINGVEDLRSLKGARIHAILMGTGLIKSHDIGRKVREFIL
jgi:indole-3-glycerol phosphate synthase